jgi:hypothetical protein
LILSFNELRRVGGRSFQNPADMKTLWILAGLRFLHREYESIDLVSFRDHFLPNNIGR